MSSRRGEAPGAFQAGPFGRAVCYTGQRPRCRSHPQDGTASQWRM